jgi:hypothetical protein
VVQFIKHQFYAHHRQHKAFIRHPLFTKHRR